MTSWALRHGGGGVTDDAVERFPEYVENVLAMMEPGGVGIALRGQDYRLRATPAASSAAQVWLLGSSDYSAHLAAKLGLPYVFAHHFSGGGTEAALAAYRTNFQPSDLRPEPTTFLTVNACVAPTLDEAEALARPQLLAMVALRTGQELRPQRSVEDAASYELPAEHRGLFEAMRRRWVIGTPEGARAEIEALAGRFDVDEVMVHPVAGAPSSSPAERSLGREETLRLLGT